MLDNVNRGTFDLYQSYAATQVPVCFDNLGAGQHTMKIVPLGKKNKASKSKMIVVDGFRGPITPLAPTAELATDTSTDEITGILTAVNAAQNTVTVQPSDGGDAVTLKVDPDAALVLNGNDVAVVVVTGAVVLALDVDFAVGGSVKWLCGGPGNGWLYVRPDLSERLEPTFMGWQAHARPFGFEPELEYASGAARFLTGPVSASTAGRRSARCSSGTAQSSTRTWPAWSRPWLCTPISSSATCRCPA